MKSLLSFVVLTIAIACSTSTSPVDGPVTFDLSVQYDTVIQSYYTSTGALQETRGPTTSSISGTLVLDPFSESPNGEFTCVMGCSGVAASLKNLDGTGRPGAWTGDTLDIVLFFSLAMDLDLTGVYRGDSIVGAAEQRYQAASHIIYTGHFMARRRR